MGNLSNGAAWLALALQASTCLAAENTVGKPARVLTPASAWQINYADDSCRLGRMFTDGKRKAIVTFDRFQPGEAFNLMIAGKMLPIGGADRKITVAFGPNGASRTFADHMELDLGDVGQAHSVAGFGLVEDYSGEGKDKDAPPAFAVAEVTAAQEAAITWLEIGRPTLTPTRFALGEMSRPMQALEKCTDELVSHWGIDVAAHRTLSKPATPKGNPGDWVSPKDYPASQRIRGQEGVIQFRLIVDDKGAVDSCHIQQSTRPAEFDEAVCRIMTERARFDPALDAAGKPIKSYWRSSFRFQMAR